MNTFCHTIQLIESFTLHNITQPATGISFLIYPWHRISDIKLGYGFQLRYDFGRRRESNTFRFRTFRQSFQEFENIGRQRLSHTKRTQFHKNIDNLFFLWKCINPTDIFVCKQRIFRPIRIRETQTYIIRQFEVPQQKFKARSLIAMIYIVRALPTQYMLGTFRQHSLESQRSHQTTDFIWINQTGVTEHFRFLAKHLLHLITLTNHFFTEAIFISKWRQTMRIRLAKEFTTAGIIQLMQQVDHCRSMNFQLLQRHAWNRKRNFESTARILHHFNQCTKGRNIWTLGNFIHTHFVRIIIIIVMIITNIEETIAFQMYNLMYLKIKTDSSHFCILFRYLP